MKKLSLTMLGVGILLWAIAQNRFLLPNKQSNFSQTEWLDVMSDIANDTAILAQMKQYSGAGVQIVNKPYCCYVADEHPVIFEFCHECVWVVDTCSENGFHATVSIYETTGYEFHIRNIFSQDQWNVGDTVQYVFFIMCDHRKEKSACFLVPFISQFWTGAYLIHPSRPRMSAKVQNKKR
jgi:hypothetical protein